MVQVESEEASHGFFPKCSKHSSCRALILTCDATILPPTQRYRLLGSSTTRLTADAAPAPRSMNQRTNLLRSWNTLSALLCAQPREHAAAF